MSIRGMGLALPAVQTLCQTFATPCTWLVGNHQLLPSTPSGCIFPAVQDRVYAGVPRRVEGTLSVYIVVYHAELHETIEVDTEKNALFVDGLIDHLEEDETFGDNLVINTFVPRVEYGEADLRRKRYTSSRLTLQLTTRFNIGVTYP